MLAVWLPLNGNTLNNGLSDVSVTSGTAVYRNDGKFDKGFDLSTQVQFYCPELSGVSTFSVSLWVRIDDDENITANFQDVILFYDRNAADTTDGNLRLETCYGSNYPGYTGVHWHDNATNAIGVATDGHYVGERGIWHHICATWEEGVGSKYYTNGELVCTSNTHNGGHLKGNFSLGDIIPIAGCVNDVRVYTNQVLSLREIKELSKGLVGHWPLSREGFGCDNYAKNTEFMGFTDWIQYGTWDITEKDGYTCAHCTGNLQATNTIAPYTTFEGNGTTLTPYNGLEITLSADVYFENIVKGTTNYLVGLYKGGQTIDGTWKAPTIVSNSEYHINSNTDNLDPEKLNGKGWTRVFIAFRFGGYQWTSNYVFYIYARDFTGDFYVKNPKVEYGLIPTPWVPNPADALYTKMGLDNAISYDVSGYCHNGVKTNISYSGGSPRYEVCSVFNGTDSLIKIENFNIHNVLSDDWTFAWWVYNDDNNRSIYFSGYGFTTTSTFGLEKYDTNLLRLYWSARPDIKFSSSRIPVGEWSHIAITRRSTTLKIYINGTLVQTYEATLDISRLGANTTYGIGRDTRTGDTTLNGKMSDFRIYATCLSDSDIQLLYQSPISITNGGTLLASSFNEV